MITRLAIGDWVRIGSQTYQVVSEAPSYYNLRMGKSRSIRAGCVCSLPGRCNHLRDAAQVMEDMGVRYEYFGNPNTQSDAGWFWLAPQEGTEYVLLQMPSEVIQFAGSETRQTVAGSSGLLWPADTKTDQWAVVPGWNRTNRHALIHVEEGLMLPGYFSTLPAARAAAKTLPGIGTDRRASLREIREALTTTKGYVAQEA